MRILLPQENMGKKTSTVKMSVPFVEIVKLESYFILLFLNKRRIRILLPWRERRLSFAKLRLTEMNKLFPKYKPE